MGTLKARTENLERNNDLPPGGTRNLSDGQVSGIIAAVTGSPDTKTCDMSGSDLLTIVKAMGMEQGPNREAQ